MGKQARLAGREARLEAMRAAQRRAERRRRMQWIGAVTAVLLVVVGGLSWLIVSSRKHTVALTGLVTYSNLSRNHVSGKVTYAQVPPAGGEHSSVWLNCGIYTQPVPNENAVHSLEHGAIWVTYQPSLAASQVSVLRADLKNRPYGLLSPYPGIPTPIVATVWGTQLRLRSASDPRLAAFIAKYADGSHAPEPQGECTGGVGSPQHS